MRLRSATSAPAPRRVSQAKLANWRPKASGTPSAVLNGKTATLMGSRDSTFRGGENLVRIAWKPGLRLEREHDLARLARFHQFHRFLELGVVHFVGDHGLQIEAIRSQ